MQNIHNFCNVFPKVVIYKPQFLEQYEKNSQMSAKDLQTPTNLGHNLYFFLCMISRCLQVICRVLQTFFYYSKSCGLYITSLRKILQELWIFSITPAIFYEVHLNLMDFLFNFFINNYFCKKKQILIKTIQQKLEKHPAIGSLFFNYEKILQVPAIYLQALAIYFKTFKKLWNIIHNSCQIKKELWNIFHNFLKIMQELQNIFYNSCIIL